MRTEITLPRFSQSESDCGFRRRAAMCAHSVLRSIAQSALADCAMRLEEPAPDLIRGRGGPARAALMVRDGARPEHQEDRDSVSGARLLTIEGGSQTVPPKGGEHVHFD